MADNDLELSKRVLDGLRRLGFTKMRVEMRAKIYDNATEGATFYHRKKYCNSLDVIMTGSRREGMAGFWESDTDQLIIPIHVLCVDKQEVDIPECQGKTIFTLEYKGAPEGYAYLKLHSIPEHAKCADVVKNDCVEREGSLFLANDQTLCDVIIVDLNPNKVSEHNMESSVDEILIKKGKEKPHGPARPFTLRVPVTGHKLDYDNVFALKCLSHHLTDWCETKKGTEWPSDQLVRSIRGLDSYVVPIGVENTEDEHLQWRISHALAEIELVKSFNDTQIKVYGLMKLIGKDILEEALRKLVQQSHLDLEVPSLSYIIKNVMFWLSEEEQSSGFTEELFKERVVQTLQKLLVTMKTGHLPSYMIPSRNVCTKKLTEEYRKTLQSELELLLSEGLEFVKRVPKLQEHVEHPNPRKLDEQAKRRQIEEYFFLAPFTLPPEKMADVKQQFRNTKWTVHAIKIYFREVWPYFLQTVTDDMFEEFENRSDFRKFMHVVSEYIGLRTFLRYIKQLFKDMVFEEINKPVELP